MMSEPNVILTVTCDDGHVPTNAGLIRTDEGKPAEKYKCPVCGREWLVQTNVAPVRGPQK